MTTSRIVAAMAIAGAVLMGATAARAEVLLGGGRTDANGVFWTAPGNSMVYPTKFGTVGGHIAAATPVPQAGILVRFRLWVRDNGQDGGFAKLRVFVNGAATSMSCVINVAGPCLVATSINIAEGDDIAVKVQNELTAGGQPTGIVFSYGIYLQ